MDYVPGKLAFIFHITQVANSNNVLLASLKFTSDSLSAFGKWYRVTILINKNNWHSHEVALIISYRLDINA